MAEAVEGEEEAVVEAAEEEDMAEEFALEARRLQRATRRLKWQQPLQPLLAQVSSFKLLYIF